MSDSQDASSLFLYGCVHKLDDGITEASKKERKKLRKLRKCTLGKIQRGEVVTDEEAKEISLALSEARELLGKIHETHNRTREELERLGRQCRQAMNPDARETTRKRNLQQVEEQIRRFESEYTPVRVALRAARYRINPRTDPRKLPSTPSELLPIVEEALNLMSGRGAPPKATDPLILKTIADLLDMPSNCLTDVEITEILNIAGKEDGAAYCEDSARKIAQRFRNFRKTF